MTRSPPASAGCPAAHHAGPPDPTGVRRLCGPERQPCAAGPMFGSDDIDPIDGLLNVADLLELCKLNRPDLKFRPLRTSVPEVLRAGRPIFDVIKEQDLLLHHPYTAYSTVTDFIRAAANDPDVLAIKICLYRTGQQSAIAETLIAAGEQGKQVTALIELKARFDEENNIEWAQRLERAGVHVVYGFVGFKNHCKLSLVIRP